MHLDILLSVFLIVMDSLSYSLLVLEIYQGIGSFAIMVIKICVLKNYLGVLMRGREWTQDLSSGRLLFCFVDFDTYFNQLA